MKTIQSYLPIFPGFYDTFFDGDSAMDLAYFNMDEDGISEEKQQEAEFDFAEYKNKITHACIKTITKWLKDEGFEMTLEFEKINSPREYNFYNDSIYLKYIVSSDTYEKIVKFLYENQEEFIKYLRKCYTGSDGFIPFYSNDIIEWIDDIKEETNLDHKFGSVLQFILGLKYNEYDLYISDPVAQVSSNINYTFPNEE